jgi:hypothetical protein
MDLYKTLFKKEMYANSQYTKNKTPVNKRMPSTTCLWNMPIYMIVKQQKHVLSIKILINVTPKTIMTLTVSK